VPIRACLDIAQPYCPCGHWGEHDDIRFGKSGFQQPLRHGLRGHSRAADGVGGTDFDELLEDVVRILPRDGIALSSRANGLRA